MMAAPDIWSQWLLRRRFGGDPQQLKATLEFLYPIRDKVLDNAKLGEGETLLDVGCGDGLIAFGALGRVKTCHVILSDISRDLLDHARSIADQMHLLDRCQFICASADQLEAIPTASVDVVTTRSVLIYVAAKQQAFDEFYRVLKPNGRLSLFEPINRFGYPEPPHRFGGYDVTPVMDLAQKIGSVYRRIQPDDDPMLDFDERDLIRFADRSGLSEIHLELQADVAPHKEEMSWEVYSHTAWNPKIPTLEEAIKQVLTTEEAERFVGHLRPLVESTSRITRSARAYLWAVKH
jgi:SAM-dependent methyltransferase